MTRHEIREEILKIVFSYSARLASDPGIDIGKLAKDYIVDSMEEEPKRREAAYIIDKSSRIAALIPELDALIREKAEGWTIKRMGKVELNIIRIAVYEILFDDAVPNKVAVNEAVELAREYAGEGAPGFVNGLLKHFL